MGRLALAMAMIVHAHRQVVRTTQPNVNVSECLVVASREQLVQVRHQVTALGKVDFKD